MYRASVVLCHICTYVAQHLLYFIILLAHVTSAGARTGASARNHHRLPPAQRLSLNTILRSLFAFISPDSEIARTFACSITYL
jgi:hypothetical protein